MILGSGFSRKNQHFLGRVAQLSVDDTEKKISVKEINTRLKVDRTDLKNRLEYMENLGCLEIKTIGRPGLYGHVSITKKGLKKAAETE